MNYQGEGSDMHRQEQSPCSSLHHRHARSSSTSSEHEQRHNMVEATTCSVPPTASNTTTTTTDNTVGVSLPLQRTNERGTATAVTNSNKNNNNNMSPLHMDTDNNDNDNHEGHNSLKTDETTTTTASAAIPSSSSSQSTSNSSSNSNVRTRNDTTTTVPPQPPPPPLSSTDQAQQIFEERFGRPSRKALRDFFYPNNKQDGNTATASNASGTASNAAGGSGASPASTTTTRNNTPTTNNNGGDPPFDNHETDADMNDRQWVESFWRTYDDIIFISLFTQVGMVFRLAAAKWFSIFDSTFRADSALFVNLPLNCLAAWSMGFLCDGPSLMAIVETRFTPLETLQQQLQQTTTTTTGSSTQHADNDETPCNNDATFYSSVQVMSPGGQAESVSSSCISDDFDDVAYDVDYDNDTLRQRGRRGLRRMLRRRQGHRDKRDRTRWTRQQQQQQRAMGDAQLREVQLLALERRIRASPCLVLFPVKKEDVDVMDHYFDSGYQRSRTTTTATTTSATPTTATLGTAALPSSPSPPSPSSEIHEAQDGQQEQSDVEHGHNRNTTSTTTTSPTHSNNGNRNNDENGVTTMVQSENNDMVTVSLSSSPKQRRRMPNKPPLRVSTSTASTTATSRSRRRAPLTVPSATDEHDTASEAQAPGVDRDLDQIIHDVSANISHNIQDVSSNITTNISRMRRLSLAEGWDVGTSAQAMSDDLLLGLRDGFCGALSTFSSWSSSMVNLLRNGQVSDAFVGYVIGIQLPIVAYRFGQNMVVYLFIWRCRKETRRDERRGYGIRLPQADEDSDSDDNEENFEDNGVLSPGAASTGTNPEESEMPSVRAIATAIFMLSIVTQLTSLSFFTDPAQHQIALALFFSPLGVLTRWRISRYNRIISGFPVGTFISNMLGCALSGSLGQLLAGNPGPRERIVLQSLIRGFAGSLSSVSALVVEVLAGTDPLLFRFDGFTYAACTIFWGMIIGFLVETTLDWAEYTPVDAATDDGGGV